MTNDPSQPFILGPGLSEPPPLVTVPGRNSSQPPVSQAPPPTPSTSPLAVTDELFDSISKRTSQGLSVSSNTTSLKKELEEATTSLSFFTGGAKKEHLRQLAERFMQSILQDFYTQGNELASNVASYEQMTLVSDITQVQELIQQAQDKHQRIAESVDEARIRADEEIQRIQSLNAEKVKQLQVAMDAQTSSIRGEIDELNRKRDRLKSEIETIELDQVALYDFYNPAQTAIDLKEELTRVRQRAKQLVKDKNAISADYELTYSGSESQGRKFVANFVAVMLTAYNQEVENTITQTLRSKDIEKAFERLARATERIEKSGVMVEGRVTPQYRKLRERELELAFKYAARLEQEKEEQAEEKRRLREEAAEERAIRAKEAALLKQEKEAQQALEAALAAREATRQEALAREGTHLENVLSQLGDIEEDPEIQKLKARLATVQESRKETNNILANLKAGYVYVISNRGSFGEGVVKIGMTRRADPMDRVRELGDASVPFHFAVHMLHFSSNAFGLENQLHKKFADRSVNRVNMRKEFFRATPVEVQQAIKEIAEGATVSFDEEAVSSDYAETLAMEHAFANRGTHRAGIPPL